MSNPNRQGFTPGQNVIIQLSDTRHPGSVRGIVRYTNDSGLCVSDEQMSIFLPWSAIAAVTTITEVAITATETARMLLKIEAAILATLAGTR